MITIEHKRATDGITQLTRWRCACGRHGVWLERSAVADSNGRDHEEFVHGVSVQLARRAS